jgi:hypothetical protein
MLELGDEQDFASGLAPFQAAVRLCHIGERKGKFYTHLQLARGNPAEYIASAFFQTGTVGDVVEEAGTRQEERALGTEDSRITWCDRSTGLPIEYQVSQRLQAISVAERSFSLLNLVEIFCQPRL